MPSAHATFTAAVASRARVAASAPPPDRESATTSRRAIARRRRRDRIIVPRRRPGRVGVFPRSRSRRPAASPSPPRAKNAPGSSRSRNRSWPAASLAASPHRGRPRAPEDLQQVAGSTTEAYNERRARADPHLAHGGVAGMFKGNGANCIRIVPNSASKFLAYEYLGRPAQSSPRARPRREARPGDPPVRRRRRRHLHVRDVPLDMVRGRLTVQVDGKGAKQYRTMTHAARVIAAEEWCGRSTEWPRRHRRDPVRRVELRCTAL